MLRERAAREGGFFVYAAHSAGSGTPWHGLAQATRESAMNYGYLCVFRMRHTVIGFE